MLGNPRGRFQGSGGRPKSDSSHESASQDLKLGRMIDLIFLNPNPLLVLAESSGKGPKNWPQNRKFRNPRKNPKKIPTSRKIGNWIRSGDLVGRPMPFSVFPGAWYRKWAIFQFQEFQMGQFGIPGIVKVQKINTVIIEKA